MPSVSSTARKRRETEDEQQSQADATPGLVPWPSPITEAGMYGIAGEYVRLVDPHTEADPNIVLLTFIVYAGNVIGRKFYVATGGDRQCGNLYLGAVGHTAHGRKGSAISVVEAFFRHGTYAPGLPNMLYGISSGEGIINEIRDPIRRPVLNKKTGKLEDTVVDAGVSDKRLIVCLSEMQQAFATMRRSDSILSSVLRQGWDKDVLSSPSKNSGVRSTGAYLSLVGGIPKEELLRQVTANDTENGTLNRFMLACSRRSKKLPEGGKFFELISSPEFVALQQRFNRNIANANGQEHRIQRNGDAGDDWGIDSAPNRGVYDTLTQVRPGLWGDVTARGAQQVIRTSLITAVINGYREIRLEHQDAGREHWRYCDDSVKYIFGGRLDDPTAIEILAELRKHPGGLTRKQIYDLLNRNRSIDPALKRLADLGVARFQMDPSTGGRPAERWFAM